MEAVRHEAFGCDILRVEWGHIQDVTFLAAVQDIGRSQPQIRVGEVIGRHIFGEG